MQAEFMGHSIRISARRAWHAMLCLTLLILAGCDAGRAPRDGAAGDKQPATGFVAGIANLVDAKDHAGIEVYLAGSSHSARTDAKGDYLISGVPKGAYTVMAECNGYKTATVGEADVDPEIHTRANPLVMKTEILERGSYDDETTGPAGSAASLGSIVGRVVLQDATNNENVRVVIEKTRLVTVTDYTGTYTFENIDPRQYTLTFTRPGYDPRSQEVTVKSGDVVQVPDVTMRREQGATAARLVPTPPAAGAAAPIESMALAGGRRIEGTIELLDPAGIAITDYTRAVVALDNSDVVVTPDAQGRFVFDKLAPGAYTVLASLDGGPPQLQTADLTAVPVAQVRFRLGGAPADQQTTGTGTVTGRVVLPGDNDQPLPDAGGVRISIIGSTLMAATGKDGRFRLENVQAGERTLDASMDGYEPFRYEGLLVAGGQTIDLGDIVLEPKRDYPRVIGTTPQPGASDVVVGMELAIVVKFNKPMNPGTVKQAVRLEPSAAARVIMGRGGHPMADDQTLVMVLNNSDERSPIRFNTNYRVLVAKSASDINGLGMKQDYSFTFRTGGAGVVSTIPGDGDKSAFVNQVHSPLIIKFNTRIRRQGLTVSDFRIRPRPTATGSIFVDDDPRTGWSTVQLTTPLSDDTNYTVTVSPTVRAYNGQKLSNTPYTFRFRTAKPIYEPVQPNVIF